MSTSISKSRRYPKGEGTYKRTAEKAMARAKIVKELGGGRYDNPTAVPGMSGTPSVNMKARFGSGLLALKGTNTIERINYKQYESPSTGGGKGEK